MFCQGFKKQPGTKYMGIGDDILKDFLKQHPEAAEGNLSEDDLRILIGNYQQRKNESSDNDFDGLSPEQMHELVYFPMAMPGSISIRENCEDEIIDQVPLYALSSLLLNHIVSAGKIKLTPKGNLPVTVCEILYSSNNLYFPYKVFVKKIVEDDIPYIWVIKDYLLFEGIVKKRNNILTLTVKGEKYLLKTKKEQLKQLLFFFTQRLNWMNFFDNNEDVSGKLGWAYSLYLLKKYGSESQSNYFYSGKLYLAFGHLNKIGNSKFDQAYQTRFFDYFCEWFGFTKIDRGKGQFSSGNYQIIKSDLFDKLFS